jgi:aspartate/methionine/tyrosine aminotransferase
LISAGSKAIIFMAMQALLNRGDLVMIQEPAWLSYQEQVKLVDAVPYFVPFDYPLHKLENALRSGTRLLVLNNPNNPAGRLYSEGELRTIYRMCRAHDIVLLVDEAYSDSCSTKRSTRQQDWISINRTSMS